MKSDEISMGDIGGIYLQTQRGHNSLAMAAIRFLGESESEKDSNIFRSISGISTIF